MKRTYWYAAMTHPVELALPSRAARIQQGGDEVSAAADRMAFYEAVIIVFGQDRQNVLIVISKSTDII